MKSLLVTLFLHSVTIHAFQLEMPKPIHIRDLDKVTAAVSIIDYGPKKKSALDQCVEDQEKLFNDLCGESSVGYEEMIGSDAFFEGVKCGAIGVKYCLEAMK